MAKTTEQLEHALGSMDVKGVELRAVEVVGEGSEGSEARDREVERVRAEVRWKHLSVPRVFFVLSLLVLCAAILFPTTACAFGVGR